MYIYIVCAFSEIIIICLGLRAARSNFLFSNLKKSIYDVPGFKLVLIFEKRVSKLTFYDVIFPYSNFTRVFVLFL